MSTTAAANAVKISQPEDALATSPDDAKISDFEDIASYNWLDEPNPTILVPGSSHVWQKSLGLFTDILLPGIPPVWNPPGVAPHLRPDSGACFVDQNQDRNPWSLLEPLVLAVLHMQPDFDLALVDVITDRRPIHQLHAFVNGKDNDFEFGAEVVNNTVLFARKEEQSRQTFPPGTFAGYRRAFEEEYTTLSGCAKGSTSHHRIVGYNFGGFRLLVRSAVDAYLESLTVMPEKSGLAPAFDEDDAAKYMKSISLAGEAPTIQGTSKAPMTIVDGGGNIPHGALLELKTRFKFSKYPYNLEDKMVDLWISQTQNFVLASYQNGGRSWQSSQQRLAKFVDLDVKSMHDTLKEWEAKNEKMLYRLSIVLREVVDAVKNMHAPCVVRYGKETGLQVLKAEDGTPPLLPEELCDKWFDFADSVESQEG